MVSGKVADIVHGVNLLYHEPPLPTRNGARPGDRALHCPAGRKNRRESPGRPVADRAFLLALQRRGTPRRRGTHPLSRYGRGQRDAHIRNTGGKTPVTPHASAARLRIEPERPGPTGDTNRRHTPVRVGQSDVAGIVRYPVTVKSCQNENERHLQTNRIPHRCPFRPGRARSAAARAD